MKCESEIKQESQSSSIKRPIIKDANNHDNANEFNGDGIVFCRISLSSITILYNNKWICCQSKEELLLMLYPKWF